MRRRDSRTDEQRQADIEAEREIHRTRREQGLPPIHYSVDIQVTVRDVTDDDVKAITTALHEAAQRAATERALDQGYGSGVTEADPMEEPARG